MKFIPLILAGMLRKRARALLMLLQMASAFLLFGLLQGFNGALKVAISQTHGRPDGDAVTMTQVDVIKKDGRRGTMYLVGVTLNRSRQPPDFTIVAGRDIKPAVREIVVSEAVRDTYRNMNLGDHIKLRGSEWTVVGVYENTGGGSDSQAVTDAETFMSAFNRNEYMQADVTLASPGDFQKLKDALTSDPSISVDVKTEAEMQQANFGQLYRIFDFVAYFIGAACPPMRRAS